MRVVFYPDYKVSVAEAIVPAADLSEQISTAGYEASGTGNMKLAMNGALTIGTLDGANVEIAQEVGAENIYIFGLTAAEVIERRMAGNAARFAYDSDPNIHRVLTRLTDGTFSSEDRDLFAPVARALLDQGDYYMHLSDFADYAPQARAGRSGLPRRGQVGSARHPQRGSQRTLLQRPHD